MQSPHLPQQQQQIPSNNSVHPMLRHPNDHSSTLRPPPLDWIRGRWHITHSTLPIWKNKRNVTITYTPLPQKSSSVSLSSHTALHERLEDVVEYQTLDSDKVKHVKGIDTSEEPAGPKEIGTWNWRGTGVIKVASSHWEVLGWGVDCRQGPSSVPNGAPNATNGISGHVNSATADGNMWMVTWFQSTVFTPMGIDIYSRSPAGLSEYMIAEILEALAQIDDQAIRKLASQLVELKRDGCRTYP